MGILSNESYIVVYKRRPTDELQNGRPTSYRGISHIRNSLNVLEMANIHRLQNGNMDTELVHLAIT